MVALSPYVSGRWRPEGKPAAAPALAMQGSLLDLGDEPGLGRLGSTVPRIPLTHGAWATIVITSALIFVCFLIRRHYRQIGQRIKLIEHQVKLVTRPASVEHHHKPVPPFDGRPLGSIPASEVPSAVGPRGSMRGPVPSPLNRGSARTCASLRPPVRRSSPTET